MTRTTTFPRFLLLAFLYTFMLCASVQAQTFVDSSASWADEDGTEARPFNSIADVERATGAATVGLQVKLKRGSTFTVTNAWLPPSVFELSAYGSGAKPIIQSGFAAMNLLAFTGSTCNVRISDIVFRQCNGIALRFEATNIDVKCCRVEVRQIIGGTFSSAYGIGATASSGRFVGLDCLAYQVDGDGFAVFGSVYSELIRCSATFCGAKWANLSDAPTLPTRTRRIYVDPVSGSDSNDGLSPSRAIQTATQLATIDAAGDEIAVKAGTTLTTGLPLAVASNTTITTYGPGPAARFKPSSNAVDAFTVAAVSGVWFVNISVDTADEAFALTGNVMDCYWVNCLVEKSNNGVECASGGTEVGALYFYGCIFDDNVITGASFDGSRTVNVYGCTFNSNDGTASGSGLKIAGAATTLACYDSTFRANGTTSIYLVANSGVNIIARCFVTGTVDVAANNTVRGIWFEPASATSATNPSLTVYSSIVSNVNPAAGDNVEAIRLGQAANIWNCSFWDNNDNTNTRTSYGIYVPTVTASIRNCAFELAGTTATQYYVRCDATGSNVVATNNFYYDTGAAPNRWNANGTTKSFAQWGAYAGVTDDTTGAYQTARMYVQAFNDIFFTCDPSVHPWWFVISGAGGASSEAAGTGGADLATALTAAGVTSQQDFGGRARGADTGLGTWSCGAFQSIAATADGFTTHSTSHMRAVSCLASYCDDSVHITHSSATLNNTENVFIECNFTNALTTDVGGQVGGASGVSAFYRCTFSNAGWSVTDTYPTTGLTEIFDGCIFNGGGFVNGTALRSNGVGTTSVRNCVFISPAWTWHTEWSGIFKTTAAGALQVYNSTFLLYVGPNEAASIYGIRNDAGAMSLVNNVLQATDLATVYYVRIPLTANLTLSDFNFYKQQTTNLSKWHVGGSGTTYAAWGALNKGTAAGVTDTSGAHSTASDLTLTPLGVHALQAREAYAVTPYGTAWGKGTNLAATFRTDGLGGVRGAATTTWTVGPGAYEIGGVGIFRVGNRIVFSGVVLDSIFGTDIPLNLSTISGDPSQRVRIDSVNLQHSAGSTATIFCGRSFLDQPCMSGLATTNPFMRGEYLLPTGHDAYLSFAATSGTVNGEIVLRIDTMTGTVGGEAQPGPVRAVRLR